MNNFTPKVYVLDADWTPRQEVVDTYLRRRQEAQDALEAEISHMDAQWEAGADEMMERPGEDEATYIKSYRERLAALHHEDEATDEELLERWVGAKRMIRRSARRLKARRRAELVKLAAAAGMSLVWIGLLALLWG